MTSFDPSTCKSRYRLPHEPVAFDKGQESLCRAILMLLAGAVVSILYISSSKNRVAYSICALVIALVFPELVEFALQSEGLVPDKIRPTLLVWTVMTIVFEFWVENAISHQRPNYLFKGTRQSAIALSP